MISLDLVRVIRGIPEPALLVTLDSRVLTANHAACALFCKTLPELESGALAPLVADDEDSLARYLQLCASAADAIPNEMHVRVPHGTPIPCTTLGGLAQPDERQSVIWLRLSPHEVRDSASLLLDPEGRVIAWNKRAERMQGCSAAEVLGQHYSKFYAGQDVARGKLEEELRAVAANGKAEGEGWLVRKDGSQLWTSAVITAHRSEDLSLIGFSLILRDLTRQTATKDALPLPLNVLHCMPGIVWTLLPDGTNDFVNRQWLEFTGQPLEFFQSEPQAWMSVLHPDDRAWVARIFWAGVRSGEGFSFEARFHRASDSSYVWHLNRAVPVHDSAGRLVKFVGTSTDIEALKRANQQLSNADERTRMIVDSALDAVVTMDVDGKITGWNRQAEALFGWKTGEALGRQMAETIIPEELREAHALGFKHFLATGEGPILNTRVEVSAMRRSGERFPVELTVSAAKLSNGWSCSAFLRDITERKIAEEKLRESERNLRLMTETIPEMLWSATPEGAIDYCNARVSDYTGLSEAEIQESGWMNAVHPDEVDAMATAWMRSVATGSPFRFEFRGLRAADNAYRLCVSSARPLFDGGRISKWYGTVVDMHDWRTAEEALRRAQTDLARVSRVTTMGEVAASIAHEVNQPLAAVVASSDSCLAWLSADPPNLTKARAAAARITQAATQASDIVQRVRALFRKMPPQRALLRLDDVIGQTVSLVKNEAQRKGVSLRLELEEGLPAVPADRIQLQQVILNLIVNGMEAMTGNQPASKQLVIRSLAERDSVLVAVSDSGVGVHPEQANRVFDPFFTTKAEGTGMGLSISRSIIEAHGGRLWTIPNQPRGAIFQFVLPVEANIP